MLQENIKRTIVVEPSAQELAQCFMHLGSDEQAAFLNECARIKKHVIGAKWCFQLQYVTDDKSLTDEARSFMEEIGQYAYNQAEDAA